MNFNKIPSEIEMVGNFEYDSVSEQLNDAFLFGPV